MTERRGRASVIVPAAVALVALACGPSSSPVSSPPSSRPAASAAPSAEPTPARAVAEGVLVTYKSGTEVGRERWRDDGLVLSSELTLPGKALSVKLPHAPGRLELVCDGESVVRTVPAGTIALENGSWQAYAIAAKRYADARAPTAVQILIPCLGKTVPGTIAVTRADDGGSRVEVAIGGLTVTAEVSPAGVVTRAAVPAQGLEVRALGEPPPAVAERPAPEGIAEQPFETTRGGVALRGAIWTPPRPGGDTPHPGAPARLPLVVFIAGSGPTDRDGNSALGLKSDVYRLLAEGLARKGVASLRYDKRGTGRSGFGISEAEVTIETFVDDAAAVIAAAREGGRFSSVAVAGHSEGGLIALMLAPRVRLDGLALLACGGRPLGAILREQLARKLDPKTMGDVDRILAALRAGKPIDPVPAHLETIFRPSVLGFLKSELDVDPVSLLRPLKMPTAIVQGESDAQITVADARLLAAARPDAKLVLLPKASHVFKDEPSAALPQKSYTDPTLPLSAGVVDAILAVVKK